MDGRIVITGAGGFLGTNLVHYLCARENREVIAITMGAEDMRTRCKDIVGLSIYSENALAEREVQLMPEDVLLNCAYPRAMKGAAVTDGLDYVAHVFDMAVSAGIRGIANISSQSVYDPQRDHAAVEGDKPCLTGEYAIGKYCMEVLLEKISRGVPYTNIRLASLIGPGFDARVTNRMVKYAIENRRLSVEHNRQRFGYLDVEDAVRGLTCLLQMDPQRWKTTYNLGSKGTVTLFDIAGSIAKILKDEYGISIEIAETQGDALANSDLNSDLLISDIGEYRHMTLDDSLRRIIRGELKV